MTDATTDAARPMRGLSTPVLWTILAAWAFGVLAASRQGGFQISAAGVPVAVALGAVVPPLVYLLAYRLSGALRAWVAALDLAWIVGAQAWRVIGVVFVVLWALGDLPTLFALTAGIGDVLVGIFALSVTLAVTRRTEGWQASARLLVLIGMADFVAAFATAALTGDRFALRLAGDVPPVLMQTLPMAMIPAFGVPVFIILHLMTLQKLREVAPR